MKNISTIELENLISNRGSTYGFLARIYRTEVDQEFLEQMTKINLSIDADLPEISEGYRMLKSFLEDSIENAVTDLAVEYARIFLGAGGVENRTFPYESVYTSPDRLVMQDARDQVLKFYREEGLDRSEEFNEPEDHIAFELEFMSHLCQKTLEAFNDDNKDLAQSYLKKQKDFLETHLIPWVPSFCKDVQNLAREDFYKAVAKITGGYLDMEKDLINELVDEIQG